jgi:hypothetical protein
MPKDAVGVQLPPQAENNIPVDLIPEGRLPGAFNRTIEGTDGNDMLTGSIGNDSILGKAGNDIISGQSGDDSLYGGTGDDSLYGGTGANSLFAEGGDDLLVAEISELVAAKANGGTNSFDGGDGMDTLSILHDESQFALLGLDNQFGRNGLDLDYDAQDGPDNAVAGIENAVVNQVSTASIEVEGSAANNRVDITGGWGAVLTFDGDDTIKVDGESFNIYPGAGDDHVSLGNGNTYVKDFGSMGSGPYEYIQSSSGSDTYVCGSGIDKFEFIAPDTQNSGLYPPGSYLGSDNIVGFEKGVDDITIYGRASEFTITETEDQTIFSYSGGGSITVDVVGLLPGDAGAWNAGDYAFI